MLFTFSGVLPNRGLLWFCSHASMVFSYKHIHKHMANLRRINAIVWYEHCTSTFYRNEIGHFVHLRPSRSIPYTFVLLPWILRINILWGASHEFYFEWVSRFGTNTFSKIQNRNSLESYAQLLDKMYATLRAHWVRLSYRSRLMIHQLVSWNIVNKFHLNIAQRIILRIKPRAFDLSSLSFRLGMLFIRNTMFNFYFFHFIYTISIDQLF